MRERMRVMLRKEFIQALREPRMRVLLFLPPLLQCIIFGYAVNLDVDHARIAWMDMDRTPESRDLRDRFEGSGRFDVVAMPANEKQVQSVLDRSQAQAVVRVLPGFARDLARGRGAGVQVLVDGTNSNTASLILSYGGQIIAKYSTDAMGRQQNRRVLTRSPNSAVNASVPQGTARSRVWFPNRRPWWPPSKAATLHRMPVVFSQAATRAFCLDSMALVRARSPEPGGTEASTSLVTSVNLCGTVTRMVLPGSSSSRLRARKPSVMRSRPGRLCSCTMPNRQWWLVRKRPVAVTKPAEQPPVLMVAASSPVPRVGSQRRDTGSSRPCCLSHCGENWRSCWGVHLPSSAEARVRATPRQGAHRKN